MDIVQAALTLPLPFPLVSLDMFKELFFWYYFKHAQVSQKIGFGSATPSCLGNVQTQAEKSSSKGLELPPPHFLENVQTKAEKFPQKDP